MLFTFGSLDRSVFGLDASGSLVDGIIRRVDEP